MPPRPCIRMYPSPFTPTRKAPACQGRLAELGGRGLSPGRGRAACRAPGGLLRERGRPNRASEGCTGKDYARAGGRGRLAPTGAVLPEPSTTPARAGTTRCPGRPWGRSGDYPRAGGDDPLVAHPGRWEASQNNHTWRPVGLWEATHIGQWGRQCATDGRFSEVLRLPPIKDRQDQRCRPRWRHRRRHSHPWRRIAHLWLGRFRPAQSTGAAGAPSSFAGGWFLELWCCGRR